MTQRGALGAIASPDFGSRVLSISAVVAYVAVVLVAPSCTPWARSPQFGSAGTRRLYSSP